MEHDMSYIAEVAPIKASTPIATYVAPVRADTDSMPLLDVDTLPKNIFWEVLGKAVTMRRDYGSATEAEFVGWLALRLGASLIDAAGNIHVDTRFDPSHRTMFTAHTDTVHSSGGANKVHVDGKFWRASKNSALGADDGSGCALLAYLIECGTPGYYVFFRGEERGGVGSKWLANHMPELFDGMFDRAVAFDRAGYADVITHQSGGRCCSDEFADALSAALSTDDEWYLPSNGGVYTDTAEFTGLIPECTNVSVGYKNQHGDREEQDVEFLWRLAMTVVGVQWDDLPIARDNKAKPAPYKFTSKGSTPKYTSLWDDDDRSYVPGVGLANGYMFEADGEEYELLYAIDDFRKNTDREYLMQLIAEAAYPEDPPMAMRTMVASRIREDDLKQAEELIDDGWMAEQVLLELYSACCTI